MRFKRVMIVGLVLVLLTTMVVPPKRADAFFPALFIPVVGGAELAATVFMGLATLAAGIWATSSINEITTAQAEKLAKEFKSKWEDEKYQAMRERVFNDSMTWGENTTTVTVEPEIIDGVNFFEYERYSKYFWAPASFNAGTSGVFYFDEDSPYGFEVHGRLFGKLCFNFDGDQVLNFRASPNVYSASGIVNFGLDKDVAASLYKIDNEVDFFHAIQKYVPVVDASTMAPVIPNYQDVYPRITNPDRPRDIAVPTGMFRAYPKDFYGQPDTSELTYRPKTKDYISKDGLVYPAKDVVVTIPVPRVNDKGDVGVATPAGDWVSVRPGNPAIPNIDSPVIPDVSNPAIPGLGAPVLGNPAIPGVGTPAIPIPGTGNPSIPDVRSPAIPGVVNPAIPGEMVGDILSKPDVPTWGGKFKTLVTTKFPFSLPWDFMALLGVINAEPVRPEIIVNEKFREFNVKFEHRFEYLDPYMPFFRGFLVVAFCLQLVMVTRKLLGGAT